MKKILMLLLTVLLTISIAQAEDYYVDQTIGDDSRTKAEAQNINTPWRTIQRAVCGSNSWEEYSRETVSNGYRFVSSEAVGPGDTVYVRQGTYYILGTGNRYEPALNPANSGTASAWLTIQNYPGESVTIAYDSSVPGAGGRYSGPLIGTNQRNYIKWKGFRIVEIPEGYASDTGPVVIWSSNHVELDGLEIQGAVVSGNLDNHQGIRTNGASNFVIKNCRIYGYTESHSAAGYKDYDSRDGVIEHNEIYNCDTAINVKDEAYNFDIRYNLVHDSGVAYSGAGNPFTKDNINVYQNIFYNVGTGFTPAGPTDLHIFNNVVYSYADLGVGWCYGATSFDVYNNIFVNHGTSVCGEWYDNPTVYWDYNCYYPNPTFLYHLSFDQWRDNGYDQNSFVSDPLFVNPPNDFHLQPNSPCRNTGRNGVNMGAYITGNEVIGPVTGELPTCSSQGGVCCSSGQTCTGSFQSSSDCGSLCCVGGICQTPPQTCSQLEGVCCSSGQTCTGSFQSSSDCGNLCCVGGSCQSVAVCGNGNCESGETCATCPQDCLSAGQVCCNGVAYTGDCCTDSDCVSSENCINHVCTYQTACEDNDGDGYGVGTDCLGSDCDDNNAAVHAFTSCVWDGTSCGLYSLCLQYCYIPPKEVCDNGVDDDCDSLIDSNDPDCQIPICNENKICEVKRGEDSAACPSDCYCGDGICDAVEDTVSCPDDCVQCVPEWECTLEPAICPPEGIQNKVCTDVKCETEEERVEVIKCVPGSCQGCLKDSMCYPMMMRALIDGTPMYCHVTKEFLKQKMLGAPCQNNYECFSNECREGKCTSLEKELRETKSLIEKLILWLKSIFRIK